MKRFFRIFFAGLLVVVIVVVVKTLTFTSRQLQTDIGTAPEIVIDQAAITRLSGAIQIPTVSYDDPSRLDTSAFSAMISYIDTMFPVVRASLEKTVVNSFTLLYRWKGKSNSAKPSILYAHLDVVPVEEVNRGEWLHDPWAGDTAGGFLWGRGTLDDKGSMMAILEAAEMLLKGNYQPENDIYFIFGHDEEVGGARGAGMAAKLLKSKGITTRFNLDEGGMCTQGIVPFIDKPVILAGTAEKGYVTLHLKVKIKGGHSSKPEKETATGVLAAALAKVDAYRFPQKISPVMRDFIEYAGPEMDMPYKMVFANTWLFKPLILKAYQNISAEGNALTRTTQAITIMEAGVKENLIPGEASAKVNFRIITGESVASVISTVKKIIDDDRVIIEMGTHSTEPSPVTGVDTWGFKLTQQMSAKVFPDAVFSPFLMLGGTDSKHFTDISESLVRCLPVRMTSEQLRTVHGVNERIGLRDYMEMIAFYNEMIRQL